MHGHNSTLVDITASRAPTTPHHLPFNTADSAASIHHHLLHLRPTIFFLARAILRLITRRHYPGYQQKGIKGRGRPHFEQSKPRSAACRLAYSRGQQIPKITLLSHLDIAPRSQANQRTHVYERAADITPVWAPHRQPELAQAVGLR